MGPEGGGNLWWFKGWDAVYERELKTFQDYGATGEIWFGEESMYRVIRWMQKHKIPLDASVLDIGTGNGVFLVELVKHGFSNITGIDYSPSAIKLSASILEKEGLSDVNLKDLNFSKSFQHPSSALEVDVETL
ncbi:EEF1A lysine methyltransferase 2 isoform X7 [Rattus norvegicus]|uniref:EEF1A lysine methyltransferase 2 isoform X7 n=1 Tax=Rattus norvegicus TaxID=10116 RepID=UPI002FD8790C